MLKLKFIALAGLGAFVLSGPMQYFGVVPQTALGDASKAMFKMARSAVIPDAIASCRGVHPNNGFGNGGGDGVPGKSGKEDHDR